jgi:adenylate cyclase
VGDDVSSYSAVELAWEGKAGWIEGSNLAGVERVFDYRPMKEVATIGSKPWTLLVGIDASEALAPIHSLTVEFAIGLVAILLACILLSRQLAVSIRQPVQHLVHFAADVGKGDLQKRVAIGGRDEMGQLGGALNRMVTGLEERDRVKEIFGRYVTAKVSEKILQGNLNLGGELRNLTVLISDIRNFTAMSESMAAEEVVAFLNDYFSEMVEAVFEESGVLDKFIGDGLLAVYGSLDETPDHPRRAVRTALRMQARVEKINRERAAVGKPPIAIGIGIHTDEVVVGNIGSRRRLEYTVIGDGVNTCSRIESLNKEFGTTILITESTHAALGDEFECRPMPEAHLKGKTHAPKVYEVVGVKAETAQS